jgi:hypothetical protein
MKKTTLLLLCLSLTLLTQAKISVTVNCTPGSLNDSLAVYEKDSISGLTLKGNINAIDFEIMRDSLINLAVIDMDSATIDAYTGTLGTVNGNHVYAANTIPDRAFTDPISSAGKLTLKTVKMPFNITAIGYVTFSNCMFMTSADIPSSVTTIGAYAFSNCIGLHSLVIPASVKIIGTDAFAFWTNIVSVNIPATVTSIAYNAFAGSSGMITVDGGNPNYSSGDGLLFNKAKTKLMQCPTSKAGDYVIPSTVSSVDTLAFQNCVGLTSLTIPASVATINEAAFRKCNHLVSLFSYRATPVDLTTAANVFLQDSVTKIILYVPEGSLSAYQAANQWSDFTNIVEFSLGVSSDSLGVAHDANSKDSVDVTSNTKWTASSDQSWLVVSPTSDSANGKLIFTATANTAIVIRQAVVTLSAVGVVSKTVKITQAGSPAILTVSSSTADIAKGANSTATIDVTSNTSWGTNSNQSWLVIDPVSGTGNATITLTAEANTTVTTRQATVTLSATGAADKTITVTQAAGDAVLTVSDPTASVAKDANSTATVDVTSNTAWTASSNQSWLDVSPTSGTGNGTLTFTAEANPANTSRDAIVTVSATGVTSKTVTVTQAAGTNVGVNTETTESISLYPNPTKDMVYILTVENLEKIVICNIEGREMVRLNNFTAKSIDMTSFEKGVYLLFITTDKGTSLKKIVKE